MKMKTVLLSSVMALPLLARADLAKMSLDGTWDFSFARGVELPAAKVDFVATDKIVVPGCFDMMP